MEQLELGALNLLTLWKRGDIVGSNGNFVIADFSTIYAYNGATGTWSSQSTNTVEEGDIVGSNGNFVIADFSTIYELLHYKHRLY